MKDYKPYTEEEYVELKSIMDSITTHIPNDRMGWIWNNHNKILNTHENQPCSCGSASKHWIRAVSTIKQFIEEKEALNG